MTQTVYFLPSLLCHHCWRSYEDSPVCLACVLSVTLLIPLFIRSLLTCFQGPTQSRPKCAMLELAQSAHTIQTNWILGVKRTWAQYKLPRGSMPHKKCILGLSVDSNL